MGSFVQLSAKYITVIKIDMYISVINKIFYNNYANYESLDLH